MEKEWVSKMGTFCGDAFVYPDPAGCSYKLHTVV